MLRQCPLDMFLNHRAGVILLGFQRVDDGRCRLAVSQRDGNVPEPAVVADPTNGGAGSFSRNSVSVQPKSSINLASSS